MADLKEVIRAAWLDLDAQVAPLRAREASLKDELRSVQQQIERLMGQVADAEKAAQAIGLDLTIPDRSAQPRERRLTVPIKQAIRLVLDANQNGLTSADLHRTVNDIYFHGALDRTSFSPQLSRMRSAGEVDLQDTYWTLMPEGRQAMQTHADADTRTEASKNFQQHSLRYRFYDASGVPDIVETE